MKIVRQLQNTLASEAKIMAVALLLAVMYVQGIHLLLTSSEKQEAPAGVVFKSVAPEAYLSEATDLTHHRASNENIQHTFCTVLENYKVVRSSIVDLQQAETLSHKLSWFVSSEYYATLPKGWSPSIPIAHRRLII